ncbi:unnamed protein product [Dracunculus medinensis]|uniref:Transposase n=1 Tax=Dracunculus medinensis TaxID=318479 RepID=A0A0N4U241_DRAME|nr:unnamed protein product [Dracunculus medinensis]
MITRCSYYAKLVNDLVTRTIAGTFVEGGAIAYNCVKIWNSFSHKVCKECLDTHDDKAMIYTDNVDDLSRSSHSSDRIS